MYALSLDKSYQQRLFTELYASNKEDKPYPIGCIVDTGCANTLIDDNVLRYVDFLDLGFTQAVRIAGASVLGKAIVLNLVDFGGLKAEKVLVFAAPLIGTPVTNRMLLGLNIMNNWNYEVKRSENVIEFSEALLLPIGANTENKYTNYFDTNGNYVLIDQQ
jgi:hypothetical protein